MLNLTPTPLNTNLHLGNRLAVGRPCGVERRPSALLLQRPLSGVGNQTRTPALIGFCASFPFTTYAATTMIRLYSTGPQRRILLAGIDSGGMALGLPLQPFMARPSVGMTTRHALLSTSSGPVVKSKGDYANATNALVTLEVTLERLLVAEIALQEQRLGELAKLLEGGKGRSKGSKAVASTEASLREAEEELELLERRRSLLLGQLLEVRRQRGLLRGENTGDSSALDGGYFPTSPTPSPTPKTPSTPLREAASELLLLRLWRLFLSLLFLGVAMAFLHHLLPSPEEVLRWLLPEPAANLLLDTLQQLQQPSPPLTEKEKRDIVSCPSALPLLTVSSHLRRSSSSSSSSPSAVLQRHLEELLQLLEEHISSLPPQRQSIPNEGFRLDPPLRVSLWRGGREYRLASAGWTENYYWVTSDGRMAASMGLPLGVWHREGKYPPSVDPLPLGNSSEPNPTRKGGLPAGAGVVGFSNAPSFAPTTETPETLSLSQRPGGHILGGRPSTPESARNRWGGEDLDWV